jgi:hypothetical protein
VLIVAEEIKPKVHLLRSLCKDKGIRNLVSCSPTQKIPPHFGIVIHAYDGGRQLGPAASHRKLQRIPREHLPPQGTNPVVSQGRAQQRTAWSFGGQ